MLINAVMLQATRLVMPRVQKMGKRQVITRGIQRDTMRVRRLVKRRAMMKAITKASRMPINRTNQVNRLGSRKATTKAIIKAGTTGGHLAGKLVGGRVAAVAGSIVDRL